jgi:hypothetical protein
MKVNVTSKSIQFWVKPNGIMQFSELLEKSDLLNCIVGTDNGAVVVEVDYDSADSKELTLISDLQKSEIILHHEQID